MSVRPALTIVPDGPAPDDTGSPKLHQVHLRTITRAQGFVFSDIHADADATDALDTARAIDRRRDPLVREMTRLFMAIRHDLNTSATSRALATRGEALGREAVRLDRLVDEHAERAEQHVGRSIEAGRAVVALHEAVLVGRPS